MLKLPNFVGGFMKQFSDARHKIFLVGGTVRGLIMDHPVNDWDFTTDATPQEIMKLFPHSYYNNQFGTVGIPMKQGEDSLVFEVTTHRKESEYTNVRHPDKVEWSKDLNEDLARRDFTINAIAYDGETLFDPYNGQKDISDRIIRAVGDPDKRLKEDALRLMRAIRQAAQLGFLIEKNTKDSIQKNSHLITSISWERIRDEFFKILSSKNPADGILFLRSAHILKSILPEVEAGFGVDQKSPQRHHIFDVGTHSVESLRHCPSEKVITRFATLIHDIGKVETYQKEEKTGIITFYNHEVVGEQQAAQIADRFKLSKEEKKQLVMLVRQHQFTVSEDQSDKALRRFIRQIGVENIDEMIALRTGDRLGSGAKETSWRTELFKKRLVEVQNVPFSIHDLKITGEDVMKELEIKPGPPVGEIMKQLFEMVDDEKLKNERKELLVELQKIKKTAE
ncbi:hypothetical protein COY16_04885 [Candidatus Roizmanbacteria bacterium CG_4_10_14_0_2_um_filter_39_13]|uniref:tRNA adenylyl-/cytidylyl-transferase n=1 Tax=Candidatus Roizmanbacteria bacterium CG_4_10_14_0_2_um_filter_39_13 TaxID=1974825 RepID=A0A2M7TWT5_9BACT|nr:MAG: hypothetical protein COY16_04885 [Candidatus Roizmanbacteria bacterium CG_4_10_14_0_2_um_filter_39_13]